MTSVLRFAPSPTGYLHIGGLRTALYNWVYARKINGKFRLRIEDTDLQRSTPEATQAILDALRWAKLDWDGEVVYQSARQERHKEVAKELVRMGKAYYCYLTPDDISAMKQKDPFAKIVSPWRELGAAPLAYVKPTIRLRSELLGQSILNDIVQGEVRVNNEQLDDMIMLRSDGMPTYMLAVVVDDHDMGVNLVIRGDDHLTNAFRQMQIYRALDWDIPRYAHIPLIHSQDGQKLSKRNCAVGVAEYRDAGYLPEALCNYLLRLGWGGDGTQEIISMQEAIQLFDIHDVNKAPARFDQNKLNYINSLYINAISDVNLAEFVIEKLNITSEVLQTRIRNGIFYLKARAKTLNELAEMAAIYLAPQQVPDARSEAILDQEKQGSWSRLRAVYLELGQVQPWDVENLQNIIKNLALRFSCKEAQILQLLRASVVRTFASPGICEVMVVLGKEESLARIKQLIGDIK